MFVTQPLCIVITPLNGLLREHFSGFNWRAWSWARGSNSCVSFPWAPTLVPIMGISLVSQPSDSIPCLYYMSKAYHVVVSLEVCIILLKPPAYDSLCPFLLLQLMILFAPFSPSHCWIMQKEKARKQIGGFQEPHYHGNMEQGIQLFYRYVSL
jgi:hypothetical protein